MPAADPTLARIEKRFGPRVAALVNACTDTYEDPKPDWRQRKLAYLAHLDDPHTSQSALLVSLADKLHNARAILFDLRERGDALWERFRSGSGPDQLWYYRSLAEAFLRRRPARGGRA